MIQTHITSLSGGPNENIRWPDEDWDVAWEWWQDWIQKKQRTVGILWFSIGEDGSDYVILDIQDLSMGNSP